ncbi:class I SAM-dependent methyltransferase [Propionivibrio limicola]|uniref:class I SAM-dependent methyltransferase n=1 Tax=Propionivibrio limicola TaxID=167645 RepID=UPI001290B6BD|nr:class I SAM-dependent methyltransferase [Propionivibrio limicola]
MRQVVLQFGAFLLALALSWPHSALHDEQLPWPQTAFAIGAIAFVLAHVAKERWWWKAIHTIFAPSVAIAGTLHTPPEWYLFGLITLLLFYRGALSGQVPLYLSNRAAIAALSQIIARQKQIRFIDLGAGTGSVAYRLAQNFPDTHVSGIENAPASWLIGYLRTRGKKNCHWRWGDIWKTDLSHCNIAYAFLSPAPMTRLWEKARNEMPPGSLLISNSFPIEDVEATEIIDVDDTRRSKLYCYRI